MPTGVPTTPTRTVWKPKRRKQRTHNWCVVGIWSRGCCWASCNCWNWMWTKGCYLLPIHWAGPHRSKSCRDVTASVRLSTFREKAQTSTSQVKALLTCTIWRSRVPGFWIICRQESLWWLPVGTLTEPTVDCRPCRTLWCPCRTCSIQISRSLELLRTLKEAVNAKFYSLFIHFQTPCLQLHGVSLNGATNGNFIAARQLKGTRMTGSLILQQQLY